MSTTNTETQPERDLMRFTTRDAEAVLGRPITDAEYDRIVKTLEFAIPEVFEDAVLAAADTDN